MLSNVGRFFIVCFFVMGLSGAGSNSAEEAAIRKAIALSDEKGRAAVALPDAVFWSGAYKRPIISPDKGQPRTGEGSISDRVPGSQIIKTEPIRIVVSDSKDLAYEYSKSTLEFITKTSGKHEKLNIGLLRVWQKQGGEWREAAIFTHPYEE
jgi:ketosteroid isomerase-like protein